MSNNPMTPTLRELLERVTAEHPAPWRIDDDECFRDANDATIECDPDDPNALTRLFIKLFNAAAAEVGR